MVPNMFWQLMWPSSVSEMHFFEVWHPCCVYQNTILYIRQSKHNYRYIRSMDGSSQQQHISAFCNGHHQVVQQDNYTKRNATTWFDDEISITITTQKYSSICNMFLGQGGMNVVVVLQCGVFCRAVSAISMSGAVQCSAYRVIVTPTTPHLSRY